MRPEEAKATTAKIEAVARTLAQGEPPKWVVLLLWHQGRLISQPKLTKKADDDKRRLIEKAHDIVEELGFTAKQKANTAFTYQTSLEAHRPH